MTATTGLRPRSASLGSGTFLNSSQFAHNPASNPVVSPQPRRPQPRQRKIEEPHPEAMKRHGSRSEERLKSLMAKQFENISEADEEEMASSSEECSSSGSATSLDGPSPYAIREHDRPYWYCATPTSTTTHSAPSTFGVHNGGGPGTPFGGGGSSSVFFSHPLISPKFGRRPMNLSIALNGTGAAAGTGTGGTNKLQRGFSDPVVRRKRSLSSLMDRLSGCGGSFDQLSSDFLNLPPIPEAVPSRRALQQSPDRVEEEEYEDDESQDSDCCQKDLDRCQKDLDRCQKDLDRCQMDATKGQRSNSQPSIASREIGTRCDETDCCDEWSQSSEFN